MVTSRFETCRKSRKLIKSPNLLRFSRLIFFYLSMLVLSCVPLTCTLRNYPLVVTNVTTSLVGPFIFGPYQTYAHALRASATPGGLVRAKNKWLRLHGVHAHNQTFGSPKGSPFCLRQERITHKTGQKLQKTSFLENKLKKKLTGKQSLMKKILTPKQVNLINVP